MLYHKSVGIMLCKTFSLELKWIIKINSGKLHVVNRPVENKIT